MEVMFDVFRPAIIEEHDVVHDGTFLDLKNQYNPFVAHSSSIIGTGVNRVINCAYIAMKSH